MKRTASPLMGWIVRAREACQIAFFLLFVALLLCTRGTDGPVAGFFHFDPLLGLIAMLAGRAVLAAFAWALVTVAVTVVFGRVVCGWICPLGSLLHLFSFLFTKLRWSRPRVEDPRQLRWKYVLLAFLLVASLFTLDLAGFVDPLSLLTRSLATAVLPAVANAAVAVAALLEHAGLPQASMRTAEFLQAHGVHTVYRQGALVGVLLVGLVLLNLVRPRFWCRYVCPTGALLGVLARWHPIPIKLDGAACNGCQLCTRRCPAQAGPHPAGQWKPSECMHCYSCAANCPQEGIQIAAVWPAASPAALDPARRELMLASALGLVAAPLLKVSAGERPSAKLIRPPGALPELEFLSRCIKCGACMKACPANGLHHTYNEGSALALWTPLLVPRIGYCEFECNFCGQVCPTGAIQPLSVEQKQQTKIGTAWVRKDRCQPYSFAEPCRVCEQKCPTNPKAIVMVTYQFAAPDGPIAMQAPIVDPTLCIGCGLCEHFCPAADEPGIVCTCFGEARAEKQLRIAEYKG